ncbi:MAG: beta-ketoacyl synthase N-terminal-like domain-containing protein [Phycisphaeraceae bacterium]
MSTPSPSRRIRIAGVGLVTPLGVGAWPTYRALCAGRRITDRVGEIPEGIDPVSTVRAIGAISTAQHTATDPTVEIAERAVREALAEANISPTGLATWIGTSKGAVLALTHKHAEHRNLAVAMGPHGYLDHYLMQRLGISSRGHWVAACASSLHALDAARRAILMGRVDRALVLTSEAALGPEFIHSYRRLGVLSPTSPPIQYVETPLAKERGGFVLSELGAAVVLEAVDDDHVTGLELLDTATACEADNLVQPAPGMPALGHIATGLLAGRTIDCLHPHTPGTEGHDPQEIEVLARACSNQKTLPSVYANKGALGHGLGASGLVSLVLACVCLRAGRIPPMNWLTPETTMDLHGLAIPAVGGEGGRCSRKGVHAVFAAGFAGHTAGAVVSVQ